MTFEEVRLKMGVDNRQIEPGLNDFRDRVTKAANDGHKSFIHASNGAKEFKKALHSIGDVAPGLGLALQAAFSPVGALFLALASGTTKLNQYLSDLNQKLTETAAKNAQIIGDVEGSAKAVADRIAQINEDRAGFISGQVAKGPGVSEIVGRGVARLQEFFSPPQPASPLEVAQQRLLLSRSEEAVSERTRKADQDVREAERLAKNPTIQNALVNAKSQLKQLQETADELRKRKANMQERMDLPENFLPFWSSLLPFGPVRHDVQLYQKRKIESEAKQGLADLERYEGLIRTTQHTIDRLTKIDAEHVKTLDEKRKVLAGLLDDMRAIQKQQEALPKAGLAWTMLLPGTTPGNIPILMPQNQVERPSAVINDTIGRLRQYLDGLGIPVQLNIRDD